jgi:uncharacterized protein (TIGR02145 family)
MVNARGFYSGRILALALVCIHVAIEGLYAQICDPAVAPTGLTSTYTPGTGALLQWDAVPGSVGVQLRVDLPSGSMLVKRIGSFELDQFFIPEGPLSAGTYTWRVQAACSPVPPFNVTPISASSSFMVGSGSSCPATVTDIDGNVYNTVEIDSQCWMAENLKVERYRDGSNIPTGLSDAAWAASTSGAFAVYNNEAANKATYGLLYNWFAAVDSRALCPAGWHVPTDGEWTQMITVLDPGACGSCTGSSHSFTAGGTMKTTGTLGAGTGLWQAPNTLATNSSGFSGLPSGLRNDVGFFLFQQFTGYWWTSTAFSSSRAWGRVLSYDSGFAFRSNYDKNYGLSVRCLKD